VELTPVVEAEIIHPGVRGIEQTQAHQPGGHRQCRSDRAVDQHLSAAEPLHPVHHARIVRHAAGPVEIAVLHDQREIVRAVIAGQRIDRIGIVDDDHACKAAIDLIGGAPVDMAVIPERRGGMIHRQLGRPGPARIKGQLRPAVEMSGHVHAMPVRGDGIIGAIDHVDICRASTLKPQQRTQIILLIA